MNYGKKTHLPQSPHAGFVWNLQSWPFTSTKHVFSAQLVSILRFCHTTTSKPQNLRLNTVDMNVMEMSHRAKEFKSIIEKAESDPCTLLQIPPKYFVLFLHCGATSQFAAFCSTSAPPLPTLLITPSPDPGATWPSRRHRSSASPM
ncbi:hypothetical protein VNO78_34424 [Psophocarpus tetragonolobus]|uniref:Uncharacterized protein n=1 Tax=Psophocarpus tetragonolobus TaxID=3891 RepID=A0AAN9P073_PSOTE